MYKSNRICKFDFRHQLDRVITGLNSRDITVLGVLNWLSSGRGLPKMMPRRFSRSYFLWLSVSKVNLVELPVTSATIGSDLQDVAESRGGSRGVEAAVSNPTSPL